MAPGFTPPASKFALAPDSFRLNGPGPGFWAGDSTFRRTDNPRKRFALRRFPGPCGGVGGGEGEGTLGGGSGCGPANCAGCCDTQGFCQLGLEDTECGKEGEACTDCTQTSWETCNGGQCHIVPCQDNDGDGYGVDCLEGADACDDDEWNWTSAGCDDCSDVDGDGVRGTGCDLNEDACDDDALNWTSAGCADCTDADGDGLRGTRCDLADDCDDTTEGISTPCDANGCPEGWIYIPAGDFEMGCNAGELDGTCESDEQPRHTVTLTTYCIQRYEVSVAQYRYCEDTTVCNGDYKDVFEEELCNFSTTLAGRELHPMNCLKWESARTYCQDWLGGDLPSEAQWEKAARGGGNDRRKYPWGDSPEPSCSVCNWNQCYSSGAPFTWPVGSLTSGAGDSPYGLRDMAGNVWEMTLDTYDESIYSSCSSGCTDPVFQSSDTFKVIRGGGYYHNVSTYLRTTERSGEHANNYSINLGFRCVRIP